MLSYSLEFDSGDKLLTSIATPEWVCTMGVFVLLCHSTRWTTTEFVGARVILLWASVTYSYVTAERPVCATMTS